MLILYLAVLIAALYWVSKTLIPELAKPPLAKALEEDDPFDFSQIEFDKKEGKIEKLEVLLFEKNKEIALQETELKVFQAQARAFDKIKTALDEEIQHLREQNRIFRSELGLPSVGQPSTNPIT
jgi:hypothetical protein